MSGTPTPNDWQSVLQALQDLQRENASLRDAINSQNAANTAQASPHYPEPKIALPDKFDGSRDKFRGFINQVKLLFDLHPGRYPADIIKIKTIGTFLTGTAQAWLAPLVEQDHHSLTNLSEFLHQMQAMFGDSDRVRTSESKLQNLRATEYAATFRQLSCDVFWNDHALIAAFRRGLKEDVKDLMLTMPPSSSITTVMEQAIQSDNRLFERRLERSRGRSTLAPSLPVAPPVALANSNPDAMIIDAVRTTRGPLSAAEKQHRRSNNLCLYCGLPGHFAKFWHALPQHELRPAQDNQIP